MALDLFEMIDERERAVYAIFLSVFPKNRVQRNVSVRDSFSRFSEYDIVVGNAHSPLFAVEVKHPQLISKKTFSKIVPLYKNSGAEYILLTDGNKVVYANKQSQYENIQESSALKNLIEELNKSYFNSISFDRKDVIGAINDAINTLESNAGIREKGKDLDDVEKDLKQKIKKLRTWKNNLRTTKDFEQIGDVVYLSAEKETELFSILLGKYDSSSFVKFSSARNIYALIEKQTQNMCSLSCMNDPSEKNYADDYTKFPDAVFDANTTFIISGCERSAVTDLTMWRLYGDDTKGVCVEFEIDQKKLQKNGFYLAPVSYAHAESIHYELEFVKMFFQIGSGKKWGLSLKNWNVWKHFFKKKIYSYEKEVRLLYIPETGCAYRDQIHDGELTFHDERSGVYSEMKLFKLDGTNPHFPLQIKHVWLGTNFVSRQENVDQFNYFFSKSGIQTSGNNNPPDEVFSLCQIEDYR